MRLAFTVAVVTWAAAAAAPKTTAPASAPEAAYVQEMAQWRAEREERLRSETGWLSLIDLFWLPEGSSTFGSAPENDLVLPAGLPAHGGTFVRKGATLSVQAAPGGALHLAGKPVVGDTPLSFESDDPLTLGRLTLEIIRRADRYGVRVRDPESPLRRDFKGREWFPVDARYRVTARFVADPKPQTVSIVNVLGQASDEPSPGRVEFELDGTKVTLRPMIEDGDASQWFYVFRDATAPSQTYGGGRFLYSEPAADGRVVLDFNKAYNPPCAFNPYTTCPLPPKENQLAVAIPAGERKYKK
jgi:uncharacterized protein (DUF1684 family)